MNLRDLLDELRENILNDRSDQTSGDSDYLWTDATLVRYINEAHRRFARRALVIRDSTTPEVVNVDLIAGQADYALHPSVLGVVSAKIDGMTTDLTQIGHGIFGDYQRSQNVLSQFNAPQAIAPGSPQAFGTDETLSEDDDGALSVVTLRIYPTPRAEDEGTRIKLRVVRLPIDDLTTASMSAVPEVPADHRLDMLNWAAYLALRINDHDAGNQTLADKFSARFEAHVQEARAMVLRKMRAPPTWGFGRGGFRWGS